MKTNELLAATAAAWIFTACCVNDTIYDTPNPEQGMITLTTNWNATIIAAPPAEGYAVRVGDYSATLTGATNTLDYVFAPGDYTIYAYNMAENIAVNGTMAVADYTAGMLGWFCTGRLNTIIGQDEHQELTVNMEQQVRQLTLVIEPVGDLAANIESIEGVLSGVAGSYDMMTGAHATASTVALAFARNTDGRWSATVRLLGVAGTEQRLAGTITFSGGSPGEIPLESDLTAGLIGFNDNKNQSLAIAGEVELPTETGIAAIITGWVSSTSGSGVAW